ncbi:MAG: PulJ/GspJ family protein [Actinomycetota bacterium]
MRRHLLRRRRDERGLTILELTIGSSLMLVLAVGALGVLQSTQSAVRYSSLQTQSLDEARTTLARLSHEVRDSAQIYPVEATCPMTTCLTVAVQDAGGSVLDVRYRYDSAAATLFRRVGVRSGGVFVPSGTDVPVATNLANGGGVAVFCRQAPCTVPSETAVQVVLVVNAEPAHPSRAVTLNSYMTPRNG